MNMLIPSLLCQSLLFSSQLVLAQHNQLFDVVPDDAAGRLILANDYMLKVRRAQSVRVQVIRINEHTLMVSEPMLIKFFDQDELNLRPVDVRYEMSGLVVKWVGTLTDPPVSVNEMMGDIASEVEARNAHASLFNYSISAGKYIHDSETDVNVGEYSPIAAYERGGSDKRSQLDADEFLAITMRLDIAGTGRSYSLEPLDFGGPYHLLSEVDRSKLSPASSEMSGLMPENPEHVRKRAEWDRFIESLGENPRNKAIDEMRKRKEESR